MPPIISIPHIQRERLLKKAEQVIADLIKHATEQHGICVRTPSICLSQRGKVAGSAMLQKHHIKLNAVLFWQNESEFLGEVIPHELAHLIVYDLHCKGIQNKFRSALNKSNKIKPHGREWQWVMTEVFACKPSVTHSFDVRDVAQKQFIYECDCNKAVYLSLIRHNKVQKGKQQYRCKKCNTTLKAKTYAL